MPTSSPSRRRLADLPLGVKLGASLAVMAAVSTGLTVLAVDRISTLSEGQERLYAAAVVPMSKLNDIQRSFQGDRVRHVSLGLLDDAARADVLAELVERRTTIDEQLSEYQGVALDERDAAALGEAVDAYYAVAAEQLVPAVEAGDMTLVNAVISGSLQDAIDVVMDDYQAEVDADREMASALKDAGAAQAARAVLMMWLALAVGIAAAGALAMLVVRRMLGTCARSRRRWRRWPPATSPSRRRSPGRTSWGGWRAPCS